MKNLFIKEVRKGFGEEFMSGNSWQIITVLVAATTNALDVLIYRHWMWKVKYEEDIKLQYPTSSGPAFLDHM